MAMMALLPRIASVHKKIHGGNQNRWNHQSLNLRIFLSVFLAQGSCPVRTTIQKTPLHIIFDVEIGTIHGHWVYVFIIDQQRVFMERQGQLVPHQARQLFAFHPQLF